MGTLPGGEFIDVPDGLFDINPSDFSLVDNLLLAVDGIDVFLAGLQDILDGEVLGVPLPLVGDNLSSAAQFIEDFRKGFVEDFRTEIENVTSPSENFISQKLFDLLGPSGLNLLLDSPDTGSGISATDIVLSTNADQVGVPPDQVFLQWDMRLGSTLVDVGTGIDFDIGLPRLGLETTGAIDLNIAWDLDFGFGLDFTDGFYLVIDDESELEVNVDVTVPGGGITGKLGILQVDAVDNGNTHLAVAFGIDVFNRRDLADGKLSFAELPSIGLEVGMAAQANAEPRTSANNYRDSGAGCWASRTSRSSVPG